MHTFTVGCEMPVQVGIEPSDTLHCYKVDDVIEFEKLAHAFFFRLLENNGCNIRRNNSS